MRRLLALAAILMLPATLQAQEAPHRFRPLVPPWFEPCLVYHSSFEDGTGLPDLNDAGLITDLDFRQGGGEPAPECVKALEQGFVGCGLEVFDWRAPLRLRGPAVSPHRPLTLSFWWALPRDLTIEGGFELCSLHGAGLVALFCRGKGEWCALQRPAGVLQVYYFQGIQNINGIYDFDLLSSLDLRRGVWHHTAVVFRRASTVQVYTDGKLVAEATLSGREFAAADNLQMLLLGGPLWLDELMVLDRAVEGQMIADYVRGVQQARAYLQGFSP